MGSPKKIKWLRNKELSLKAKGLLSQMLSLPEDWDYTLAGLSHINREKIDAIREAVKELEKAGYIVRSRERDEKGRFGRVIIGVTMPNSLMLSAKAYLETYRPVLFNELVLSDTLYEHCAEIDEAARNRMELIVPELVKRNGVTEQLKADNQMEWVRQMNACKAQAEEIVKAELIYD